MEIMGRLENKPSKLPEKVKSPLPLGVVSFVLWRISAAFSFYEKLEIRQKILWYFMACCSTNHFLFHFLRY